MHSKEGDCWMSDTPTLPSAAEDKEDWSDFAAEVADQLGAVGEDHGPALGADPPRRALPDPLPGTRDEDDLTGEPARRHEPGTASRGEVVHGPAGGLLGPFRVLGDEGAGDDAPQHEVRDRGQFGAGEVGNAQVAAQQVASVCERSCARSTARCRSI